YRLDLYRDPLVGRSVIAGVTLKLPTGKVSQALGSGTTDLSGMLLFHQHFGIMYDFYAHVEYVRSVSHVDYARPASGAPDTRPGDQILHNAALSVQWDPRWQALLEVL